MGAMWSNQYDDDDYDEDISSNEEDDEADDKQLSRNSIFDTVNSRLPYDDLTDNICMDSATDTTDASPRTTMMITLSLNQLAVIEQSLDLYEKVSLIYLLDNDPASALNHLTKLIDDSSERPILNWVLHQNSLNLKWQEKLVEAICIIQNYEVLKNLGYRRQDLVERFLPHQSCIFVNVNKIRKALYFICESFGQKEVQSLLSLACSDFQQKKMKFQVYNPPYLELYLLHWEAISYIKQDNLSNLCSVLKHLDQLDLYEKLKQLVPVVPVIKENEGNIKNNIKTKTEDKKISKNLYDRILDPSAGFDELASLESALSADNVGSRNKYYIDTKNPGVCLIINQENFYRDIDKKFQHLLPPMENKLETRTGTAQDKEKLVTTFKEFGFKVVSEDDLIHVDIINKIENVINNITNESSLFVCIMSHGDEGVVYGVNSCLVPVKKIKNIMCTTNRMHLSGKPKVLILQSCQGTRCQKVSSTEDDDIATDGPSCASAVVPPCADLLTFWATVPGYGAIRNKKTGSWFIQSLCDKMKTLGNKHHFEDICTQVVDDVSSKKWCQIKEEVAMVPLKDSTLRKSFYLPPIKI